MEYVFKPIRTVGGKRVKAAKYRGRFKVCGKGSLHDVPLHTSDKQVAEQALRRLVAEQEREAVGLLPARALRQGAEKSMQDHLQDFIVDLERRGRSGDYVRHVQERVSTLIEACRWSRLADVTADSFQKWRGGKAASPKTINEYLAAASALLHWMEDNGRASGNPLARVRRVEARGRETFRRRALTVEQCNALLSVAGSRRLLYLVALTTGLRRGEIEGLRWDGLELDSANPCARVRASTAKNRREALVQLPVKLALELRAVRPIGASAGDLVFPNGIPRNRDLRCDYTRAGIPLREADSKMDFHALRHTFCTLLQRNGVSPRVAMEAMRHSDMRLTAKVYTDAMALPTREAVEGLPLFETHSLPASLLSGANRRYGMVLSLFLPKGHQHPLSDEAL
jgi:integrase